MKRLPEVVLALYLSLILFNCTKIDQAEIMPAAFAAPPPPTVTTTSSDPVIQQMTKGFQAGKPAQWQEVYFIPYSVVRIDRVYTYEQTLAINWTTIFNDLKILSYAKINQYQINVPATAAIQPGKILADGWTYGVVLRAGETIAVAYRQNSGMYEVSFVKFLKAK